MKKSPLLSIFLIVLVDVLGLTIILPLLPFYAESMGATPATVGLLVSLNRWKSHCRTGVHFRRDHA